MPPTNVDPRFANLSTDPRYRPPSRKNTHVKIDKRFKRMLHDEDFSKKARVDRYGRRVQGSSGRKELERMYEVEDEDDEEAEEKDAAAQIEPTARTRTYDPAREGGFLSLSSSSESEEDSESDQSSSSEEDEDAEDRQIEQAEEDADYALEQHAQSEVTMGEVTSRLAVVNLDWDHIRAVDLMAVAQSFAPPDGRVLKVAIYPSEFGKERMEQEELQGPPPELFASSRKKKSNGNHSQDNDDEPDDKEIQKSLLAHAAAPQPDVDSKALRAYQLSRLRYFYAIITCSSESTARTLYDDMDGREYLSTSNFFDLRFVPEETTFDDKPKDVCEKVPDGYKPQDFTTEALTHSKVRLTWDEEDKGRQEAQKRAFSGAQGKNKSKSKNADIDDDDLKAYIGSDSESDESDKADMDRTLGLNGASSQPKDDIETESKLGKSEQARRKMREALGLSVDDIPQERSKKDRKGRSEPEGNMQITFSAALASDPSTSKNKNNENGTKHSVFQNKPSDVHEETTREKYIRKERERKAKRKEKTRAKHEDQDAEPNRPEPSLNAQEQPNDSDSEEDEADPFDDPFFTNPEATNASAKKSARAAKAAAETAEQARKAAERKKERAQLQLLMDDADTTSSQVGNSANSSRGQGFDMAAIKKAEKEASRKGRRKNRKQYRDMSDDEKPATDDFEMDVTDPRFASVYDSHEFAIDPSNPRFSGTKGMQRLLEEGRSRRKRRADEDDMDMESTTTREKQAASQPDAEVDELVRKIKRRNRS